MAGEQTSFTIVFNTAQNNYSVGPGHEGLYQSFATKDEALEYINIGLPDPTVPLVPPPGPEEIEASPEGSMTERILKEKQAQVVVKEDKEEEPAGKGKKKK